MLKSDDDGTINLRHKVGDAEFKIGHVDNDDNQDEQEKEELVGKVRPVDEKELKQIDELSTSMVKVKFDKFVNLVATHAYEEIFEKYREEDVIIGTDLLTDLANAHEEKSDRKVPIMFLIGIVLGCVLMWIFIRT